MRSAWLYVGILSILFACQTQEQPETLVDSQVAARAFDRNLTWKEVSSILPDQASEEDSALLAERYINDWLKEQVLLHTAEAKLPEEQKQFEQELENHRKSLLTFAYENLFVQQRLDTLISQTESQDFYEQNQDIFALNDYIVKVKFCVLPGDSKRLKPFRKLFENDSSEDLVKLEQYAVDNGFAYYVDVESWMYFEDLLAKVPLEVYNIETFLARTDVAEFEAEGKLYFVKIVDYKLKDSVSPLPLVENSIRSMILNKRKKELLASMRDALFNDAYAKKKVEKFY